MAKGFVSMNVEGMDLAIRQLSEIKSPALQEKIVQRAARQVMKSAKSRVTKQIDMNGKPFGQYSLNTNHTRPRPRSRKMLKRLVERLRIITVSPNTIAVGWASPVESEIGAKHQFGFTEIVNKSIFLKKDQLTVDDLINPEKRGTGHNDTRPASKRQAKALIEAGYKVHIKGRGKDKVVSEGKGAAKTPTIKWIMTHLTISKAGFILRKLRKEEGRDEWKTTLPARPFLGITADDLELIAAAIRAEINKTLKGAK